LEQAVKAMEKIARQAIRSIFFCMVPYFEGMDRTILALSGITVIAHIRLDILL